MTIYFMNIYVIYTDSLTHTCIISAHICSFIYKYTYYMYFHTAHTFTLIHRPYISCDSNIILLFRRITRAKATVIKFS